MLPINIFFIKMFCEIYPLLPPDDPPDERPPPPELLPPPLLDGDTEEPRPDELGLILPELLERPDELGLIPLDELLDRVPLADELLLELGAVAFELRLLLLLFMVPLLFLPFTDGVIARLLVLLPLDSP